MGAPNEEAVEIAARLGEHPELLGEVLVILGALDTLRMGGITAAAAESILVHDHALQAEGFAEDFLKALNNWILE